MLKRLAMGLVAVSFCAACTSKAPVEEQAVAPEAPAVEATAEAAAEEVKEAAGALDGKTFAIVSKSSEGETKDSLTFKDGTFDSLDCQQWGFTAASYVATPEGAGHKFVVTTKSEKEGQMVWEGTVDGDKISGKTVWTKEGQAPIEYTFEGAVAAAE